MKLFFSSSSRWQTSDWVQKKVLQIQIHYSMIIVELHCQFIYIFSSINFIFVFLFHSNIHSYMAPEILENKNYSALCDVWAMGVIMYYLYERFLFKQTWNFANFFFLEFVVVILLLPMMKDVFWNWFVHKNFVMIRKNFDIYHLKVKFQWIRFIEWTNHHVFFV